MSQYKDFKTNETISREKYIANGLERGELLAIEKCGCVIIQDRTAGAYIVYCDRHAAAPMVKTKKQIVSGYHRPVCVKCNCELRPERNGVGILDMNDNGAYELWDADMWKCPTCGYLVVGGFAYNPISAHYKMIAHYEALGILIKNNG